MRVKFIGWSVAAGLAVALTVLLTGVASGPPSAPAAGVSQDGASANAATAEFKIDGMYCSLCAANLARVLEEQPGVLAARVDFDKKLAIVDYGAKETTAEQIEKTIDDFGAFRAELVSGPVTTSKK